MEVEHSVIGVIQKARDPDDLSRVVDGLRGAAAPPSDRAEVDRLAILPKSGVTQSGYTLEAHIPAQCLNGFDPVEHRRIGFYYILEDRELGQQYLTVGDDLYWYVDPSTWATAVLTR